MNLQGQKPQVNTFGKKRLGLRGRSLSSVSSRSSETPSPIGRRSGSPPLTSTLWQSQQIFEYHITLPSVESMRIIQNQLEWSELATFTGVTLARESRGKLGGTPVSMLTLRIHGQNSGVDTLVKKMLLSMSLEVESMLVTSYVGSIGIRSSWKLKAQAFASKHGLSGLLPILIPGHGTQR